MELASSSIDLKDASQADERPRWMEDLSAPCSKALDRARGMVTKGLSIHAKRDLVAVPPLVGHLTNHHRPMWRK
ncbi:hypothetical protein Xant_21620 [Xanthomonas cissicola]|uniref:PH domain-containing protein n=1 Tax=Xanthomonas cissicola TaxID=86186 RepID=A0ABX3M0K0_9XANT|nr:hypothetical protein Xant_21620 [Xanthomonas cissicola]